MLLTWTAALTSCGETEAPSASPPGAFVASRIDGTEFYLLGDRTDSSGFTFLRGVIDHSGAAVLEGGSWELDANGTGTATILSTYAFQPEFGVSIGNRTGATRTDHQPPLARALVVDRISSPNTVRYEGVDVRVTPLEDVLAALAPDTQATAEHLATLVGISLAISRSRIPAYGGLGITRYATYVGTFLGFESGHMEYATTLSAPSSTTWNFVGYQELPGLVLDGTLTNTNGTQSPPGVMSGTLTWSLAGGSGGASPLATGTLTYAGIVTELDVPTGATGGTVTLTSISPTGGPYDVPQTTLTTLDLRSAVPVQ